SYNAATGVIGYTYRITNTQTNSGTGVTESLTVKVNDTIGQVNQATLTLNVVDDAPLAGNDTITTNAGVAATGSLATNDAAGADSPATWTIGTAPTHGTVTITAGTGAYTYTPNVGYVGSDSFTYTITDKDGDVVTATATVNVTNPGAPTVTIPDSNAGSAGDMTVAETATATANSFTVSAPAGLASITVGGTNVTLAQLNALGGTPITITTGK
ncbi:Ig-like domain-containing protein, partial [Undibacterium sp. LX40W]